MTNEHELIREQLWRVGEKPQTGQELIELAHVSRDTSVDEMTGILRTSYVGQTFEYGKTPFVRVR